MKYLLIIFAFAFLSCGLNESKQKKLEYKERDLALKELELKEKESQVKTLKETTAVNTKLAEISVTKIPLSLTTLKVPTTVGKINLSMGNYSEFEPCEDPCNMGSTYYWKQSNGLTLTASALEVGQTDKRSNSHKIEILHFSINGNTIVENCIYGLSLNKTTLVECKQKFGSKLKKGFYMENTYKFFQDNMYNYLEFNSSGILIGISKATWEYDTTG